MNFPTAATGQTGSLEMLWRRLWTVQNLSRLGESLLPALGRRGVDCNAGIGSLPPLNAIESIAVIRPDEIGDVVLTGPFLRELRRNAPRARITLFVKPATFNLVEKCPYVDEVLAAPMGTTFGGRSELRQAIALTRFSRIKLWGQFELAVMPRMDPEKYGGRLLTYLSGAPWRIGYEDPSQCHGDHRFTHALARTGIRHEIERTLDVLRRLGGDVASSELELWTTPLDGSFAQEVCRDLRGPLVAACIGAGGGRKIWPLDRFEEVFRSLIADAGTKIVLIGGTAEAELAGKLLSRLGPLLAASVIDLAGKTTLRQAAEVLRRCNLYMGNDTGPMHLAAAAGIPVITVFCHPQDGAAENPNSPERFGPAGVPAVVLQPVLATPPCDRACAAEEPHCIRGVSSEMMLNAIEQMKPVWTQTRR